MHKQLATLVCMCSLHPLQTQSETKKPIKTVILKANIFYIICLNRKQTKIVSIIVLSCISSKKTEVLTGRIFFEFLGFNKQGDGLPADPCAWDAVHGKQSELQMICCSRSFFDTPPLCGVPSFYNLGQRRGGERRRRVTKGAQVQLGKVTDGLC